MKLEIDIPTKRWERILQGRRDEIGSEFTEKEIKDSIEQDLSNTLLNWYP